VSAFIVHPRHIAEIAKIQNLRPNKGIWNQVTGERLINLKNEDYTAKQCAVVLASANCESIASKYGEDSVADMARMEEYEYTGVCSDLISIGEEPEVNDSSLYNMIRCYEYQTCEITDRDGKPAYVKTDAYWIIQAFKEYIIKDWAQQQAWGYEEDGIPVVPWEYTSKRQVLHG
tara:strand:- start:2690 stop:3211 length:522 start_codon:yes stop_codon:yes gene_type:complete